MAQSVPPGDIQTQPNAKIVFNAPYDDKHTYHIKVINSSARRIGYGIKTTNMKRLGVDPPCGVLDPKEAVLLAVSCDAFAFGQETEPPSSSAVNGSKETEWFVRVF
uniref:MSP domain-containing protein n=1 Tax=Caenorhabditis tropicalis TaxID=1561998 RepID=A0A1I7U2U5_9PELO